MRINGMSWARMALSSGPGPYIIRTSTNNPSPGVCLALLFPPVFGLSPSAPMIRSTNTVARSCRSNCRDRKSRSGVRSSAGCPHTAGLGAGGRLSQRFSTPGHTERPCIPRSARSIFPLRFFFPRKSHP